MPGDKGGGETFDEMVDLSRECDTIEGAERLLDLVGLLVVLHGQAKLAEIVEGLSQCKMQSYALVGFGQFRDDFQHPLDQRAISRPDRAGTDQVVVGAALLGIERDRPLQRLARLAEMTSLAEDPAEKPKSVSVLRIEFDGASRLALGLSPLSFDQ